MIEGVLAAIPTPFKGDGLADQAFAEHGTWLVREGVAGLSPCGITGEGSTLSAEERARLVDIAVETAAGRALVVPATGTNSTDSTIELTRRAKRAGADAALIVVPYYSRPSQEGIWRHFDAVTRAVDMPILIHNAATRTAVELPPATVARLATIPSVVGLVDDGGNPRRWRVITDCVGDTFQLLCGSDEQMATAALSGHGGCLSNLANIAPRLCVALQCACAAHDYGVVLGMQAALNRFPTCLGDIDETAAIKFLLERSRPGFGRSVRLPLTAVPAEAVTQLASAFDALVANAWRLCPSHPRNLADLEVGSALSAPAIEERPHIDETQYPRRHDHRGVRHGGACSRHA